MPAPMWHGPVALGFGNGGGGELYAELHSAEPQQPDADGEVPWPMQNPKTRVTARLGNLIDPAAVGLLGETRRVTVVCRPADEERVRRITDELARKVGVYLTAATDGGERRMPVFLDPGPARAPFTFAGRMPRNRSVDDVYEFLRGILYEVPSAASSSLPVDFAEPATPAPVSPPRNDNIEVDVFPATPRPAAPQEEEEEVGERTRHMPPPPAQPPAQPPPAPPRYAQSIASSSPHLTHLLSQPLSQAYEQRMQQPTYSRGAPTTRQNFRLGNPPATVIQQQQRQLWLQRQQQQQQRQPGPRPHVQQGVYSASAFQQQQQQQHLQRDYGQSMMPPPQPRHPVGHGQQPLQQQHLRRPGPPATATAPSPLRSYRHVRPDRPPPPPLLQQMPPPPPPSLRRGSQDDPTAMTSVPMSAVLPHPPHPPQPQPSGSAGPEQERQATCEELLAAIERDLSAIRQLHLQCLPALWPAGADNEMSKCMHHVRSSVETASRSNTDALRVLASFRLDVKNWGASLSNAIANGSIGQNSELVGLRRLKQLCSGAVNQIQMEIGRMMEKRGGTAIAANTTSARPTQTPEVETGRQMGPSTVARETISPTLSAPQSAAPSQAPSVSALGPSATSRVSFRNLCQSLHPEESGSSTPSPPAPPPIAQSSSSPSKELANSICNQLHNQAFQYRNSKFKIALRREVVRVRLGELTCADLIAAMMSRFNFRLPSGVADAAHAGKILEENLSGLDGEWAKSPSEGGRRQQRPSPSASGTPSVISPSPPTGGGTTSPSVVSPPTAMPTIPWQHQQPASPGVASTQQKHTAPSPPIRLSMAKSPSEAGRRQQQTSPSAASGTPPVISPSPPTGGGTTSPSVVSPPTAMPTIPWQHQQPASVGVASTQQKPAAPSPPIRLSMPIVSNADPCIATRPNPEGGVPKSPPTISIPGDPVMSSQERRLSAEVIEPPTIWEARYYLRIRLLPYWRPAQQPGGREPHLKRTVVALRRVSSGGGGGDADAPPTPSECFLMTDFEFQSEPVFPQDNVAMTAPARSSNKRVLSLCVSRTGIRKEFLLDVVDRYDAFENLLLEKSGVAKVNVLISGSHLKDFNARYEEAHCLSILCPAEYGRLRNVGKGPDFLQSYLFGEEKGSNRFRKIHSLMVRRTIHCLI